MNGISLIESRQRRFGCNTRPCSPVCRRPWHLVVVGLLHFGWLCAIVNGANPDPNEKVQEVLRQKGITGLVEALNEQTPSVGFISIPSEERCLSIEQPEERQEARKARETGRLLRESVGEAVDADKKNTVQNIEDTLCVRDWCLSAKGYGNLLLAEYAQQHALGKLFHLLARDDAELPQIRKLYERLITGMATPKYWSTVIQAEEALTVLNDEETKALPEYKQMTVIMQRLQDREVAKAGSSSLPNRPLTFYYDQRAFHHLAWYRVLTERKAVAFETCLLYREKLGAIPKDRETFRAELKKNFSPFMKREDRVGGKILSSDVALMWQSETGQPP